MTTRARPLDGQAYIARLDADLRARVAALSTQGVTPHLSCLTVGQDAASSAYARQLGRHAQALGMGFDAVFLGEGAGPAELHQQVWRLNENPAVHGVALLLPLPAALSAREFQPLIDPRKDVEGVTPSNLGAAVRGGGAGILPATAEAVMALLAEAGVPLQGAEAVVIGQSDLVGKPVALLLMEAFATVTVCHIETRDLAAHTRTADILVSAAGKPRLITGDIVKAGACVVDVGITRVGQDLVGDVDAASVGQKAAWLTPVPGGVGPVTVALVLRNTLRAAEGAAR